MADEHLQTAQRVLESLTEARQAEIAGGTDALVGIPAYRCILLALLGHYRLARVQSETALTRARLENRPHRCAFALGVAGCWFHAVLNEDANKLERQFAELAEERQFPFWSAFATQFRGLELAKAGKTDEGVRLVREGAGRLRDMGAIWGIPFFFATAGSLVGGDEGLELADDALRQVDTTGVAWCAPELHRIKGAILAENGGAAAAESCYLRAISEARAQASRHWELRASLNLARMWYEEGKTAQARELLSPLYGGLVEHGETPDLQESRILLGLLVGAEVHHRM